MGIGFKEILLGGAYFASFPPEAQTWSWEGVTQAY